MHDISNIFHRMHNILFTNNATNLIESDNASTAMVQRTLVKLNTWLITNKIFLKVVMWHLIVVGGYNDEISLYLSNV